MYIMSLHLAFYTYFYGSDKNDAFKIPTIPSLDYKCFYYTNNKKLLDLLPYTSMWYSRPDILLFCKTTI